MKFVLIPPGEFDMGSTEAEIAKLLEEGGWISPLPSEAPKHRVRITRPFWLGCHEVTRGQFRRFVDDSGYRTEAERDGKGGAGMVDGQWKQDPRLVWNQDLTPVEHSDDHPVVHVSWNDVTAFCQWLSEKDRELATLPTEAQWEYACRAGTTTRWYGGDDEATQREHAWSKANSGWKSHPVGQLQPNAWGLYDMHGNVWERCQDWWGKDYYASSPLEDPTGPAGGSSQSARGGSWDSDTRVCRAAFRDKPLPSGRQFNLGFRVACTVDATKPQDLRVRTPPSSPAQAEPEPKPTEPKSIQPYDLITLNKANDNEVLKVEPLDLPGRNLPDPLPKTGKLRLRLFDRPDDDYEVKWSDIETIQLFGELEAGGR